MKANINPRSGEVVITMHAEEAAELMMRGNQPAGLALLEALEEAEEKLDAEN